MRYSSRSLGQVNAEATVSLEVGPPSRGVQWVGRAGFFSRECRTELGSHTKGRTASILFIQGSYHASPRSSRSYCGSGTCYNARQCFQSSHDPRKFCRNLFECAARVELVPWSTWVFFFPPNAPTNAFLYHIIKVHCNRQR